MARSRELQRLARCLAIGAGLVSVARTSMTIEGGLKVQAYCHRPEGFTLRLASDSTRPLPLWNVGLASVRRGTLDAELQIQDDGERGRICL